MYVTTVLKLARKPRGAAEFYQKLEAHLKREYYTYHSIFFSVDIETVKMHKIRATETQATVDTCNRCRGKETTMSLHGVLSIG